MNEYLSWMASETPTRWWTDCALKGQVADALSNGAVGITTNPVLMADTICGRRDDWSEELAGFDASLTGDDRVLDLERRAGSYFTDLLSGLWRGGDPFTGGICIQVTPAQMGNMPLMMKQMEFIGTIAPNTYVKLPATKAGMKVLEESIARGYNVLSAMGVTISQCIATAEATKRGEARARSAGIKPGSTVSVIMAGRLEAYLQDVAQDNGLDIPSDVIGMASVACMKKASKIFEERGYTTMLMVASMRGPKHISQLCGAKNITLSIGPAVQKMVAEADLPKEGYFDDPVPSAIIEQLYTIPDFRKSYEEGALDEADFIGEPVINRIATHFVEAGWNRLLAFHA